MLERDTIYRVGTSSSVAGKRWVVLDGDDTLWRTAVAYKKLTRQLGEWVAAFGHDANAVVHHADELDVARMVSFGYSMHRYPQTLRDTALHFEGDEQLGWAALGLGYSVYTQHFEPVPDALEALQMLRDAGFSLAMVTAGDDTVQQRRVSDFPHAELFEVIRIVPSKNPLVFERLAADLGFKPQDTWMIGDSLRSDILPSLAAGYNAVLLECDNWALWEKAHHTLPEQAFAAASLSEAVAIVLRKHSI